MEPNRFHQLQTVLFVIQTCQPFVVVEKQAFRNLIYTKIGFLSKMKVSTAPSGKKQTVTQTCRSQVRVSGQGGL
jgi:hypothetical protein